MAGVSAMVKLEDLREGLIENILNQNGKERNNTVEKCNDIACVNRVILFFSFDVVNSTKYKSINYYGWSYVLNKIFETLRIKVCDKIQNAELWRVLGDEIIFIVQINTLDALYEYVDNIYSVLVENVEMIDNGCLFDEIEYLEESVRGVLKGQNIISLQASAWIGVVTDGRKIRDKSYRGEVDNVLDIFEEKNQGKFYEFIGSDIDAGFRIKKFTRSKRLVLSFELANLISKKEELCDNIYIITYKSLKGIWQERLYPIIWYYNRKMNANRTLGSSFPYDLRDEDNLYKEYFQNRSENGAILERNMFVKVQMAFERLIRDQNLTDKVLRIENEIKNSSKYMSVLGNPLLELHCVAVCIKCDTKEIFIAKRAAREMNAGCWEFGCAKANPQQDIIASIQDEYQRDFGLDIRLVLDSGRKEKLPTPIAIYQIQKGESLHKGIIFIAEIVQDTDIHLNPQKHSKYRYIKEEEIEKFSDKTVPDFIDTLKKGFQYINGKE